MGKTHGDLIRLWIPALLQHLQIFLNVGDVVGVEGATGDQGVVVPDAVGLTFVFLQKLGPALLHLLRGVVKMGLCCNVRRGVPVILLPAGRVLIDVDLIHRKKLLSVR